MAAIADQVRSWGESAGAISVSLQLLANGGNTEGLFRAGIMNSGGPPPTGDITEVQDTYDFVVKEVGCSTAADTLACLRTVSVDKLLAAANQTPTVISFAVSTKSRSYLGSCVLMLSSNRVSTHLTCLALMARSSRRRLSSSHSKVT